MYAPSDGAALRSEIKEKASGSVENAVRAAETLSVSYTRRYHAARFQVERLFAAVSAGVEEGKRVKDEVQKALSEGMTK